MGLSSYFFTFCLFVLCHFSAFSNEQKVGVNFNRAEIDSMLAVLPVLTDSNLVKTLIKISIRFGKFNTNEGISYGERALKEARELGLKNLECKALGVLGSNYSFQSEAKIALRYFKQSKELAVEQKDSFVLAKLNNRIASQLDHLGDYNEAINLYKENALLAKKHFDSSFYANLYQNLATTYDNLGLIDSFLVYQNKSMLFLTDNTSSSTKAAYTINIAVSYFNTGQIGLSVEQFWEALNLAEDGNDLRLQAIAMTYLGELYISQENYSIALHLLKSVLKLEKLIGDKYHLSIAKSLLGEVYNNRNNDVKALSNLMEAWEVLDSLEFKQGLLSTAVRISDVYLKKLETEEAHIWASTCFEIANKIGYKEYNSIALIRLAKVDFLKGKNNAAKIKVDKALKIAQEYKDASSIRDAAQLYAEIYESEKNWAEAYDMQQLFVQMKDSLFNANTMTISVQQKMKYHFNKRMIADSVKMMQMEDLKNAEIATQQAMLHKESIKRYSLIGGLALLSILVILSYRNFNRKTRDHRLIKIQKQKVDLQNEILGEKNKEITDSINYAERIQRTILPSVNTLNKYLTESFVLYLPKDIVAGDFYWMDYIDNKVIFAAADCTGHGVPGAMVSVVCHNALNKVVRGKGITKPSIILDEVRKLVIETFTNNNFTISDGMDIALCCMKQNGKNINLEFAGANNPLWVVKNRNTDSPELIEIKGDRQPIGHFYKKVTFQNHSIQLNKNDVLYIFSDGYADQFGGADGKKYRSSRFKSKLLKIASFPMHEQRKLLLEEFKAWKREHAQLDDICVFGVGFDENNNESNFI